MRSFYLRFRVYAIGIWAFLRNLSPNLLVTLVFLYANSLYASLIFWSLSIAYNEVQLYTVDMLLNSFKDITDLKQPTVAS
jgi:hypothetical protein